MGTDKREILLGNPSLFILHYFSDKIEKLEPFHMRLIQTATQEARSIILYPAGHGKTTLVSTCLPIWALCKDPNNRIAIIAKNEVDAKGIMRAIHAELLGNEKLIADFGPFFDKADPTKAWAVERIDVAKRTRIAKEGSIQIYGSKGNVLGKRFDWVICDDAVTDKNSATAEQRLGMREWFNLGVETMPEFPWSRLTVVGTRFHPEDLYEDLWDLVNPETGKPFYAHQLEDAIVDEEERTSLWPSRWTWDRLMEQKVKMGTIDFNKRYRNIAVDKSRILFHEEYLKGGTFGKEVYPGCLDPSYAVGDYGDDWRRIAGFDPAIGGSRQAKFCAHIVLGVGSCAKHEKCFYVVDLIRDQLTQPQQVDLIIEKHLHYDLFSTVIEINGYQKGLEQIVQSRLISEGRPLNIEPHHTSRVTLPDPELGASAMVPMIENGLLHIPWADPHSRRVMGQLYKELVEYPKGRTSDTVMALWFAWKRAQEAAPRYTSFNRLEKTGSMFNNRGGGRAIKNPAYS